MSCREYLGAAGWCPIPQADGEFCADHAAKRREFTVGPR